MDKQTKLIDADKVQSWIDLEFDKKFPNDCYGYADGRQSILDKLESKINDGSFDPDPIQLPTIKPGDKVRHPSYGEGVVKEVETKVKATYRNGLVTLWSVPERLEVSHD